ncbi:hypothetical protein LMG33810_002373 [Carnimonas sp. LMG 33810]
MGVARMRRYSEGIPLPLSLIEIEQYLQRHPTVIDRDEFDAGIYAIDEIVLQHFKEKMSE